MDRKPMTLLLGDFLRTVKKANFNITSLIEMTSHFVTTKQAPVYVSEICFCAPIMTTWVIGCVFCLWKSEKTSFKICMSSRFVRLFCQLTCSLATLSEVMLVDSVLLSAPASS